MLDEREVIGLGRAQHERVFNARDAVKIGKVRRILPHDVQDVALEIPLEERVGRDRIDQRPKGIIRWR